MDKIQMIIMAALIIVMGILCTHRLSEDERTMNEMSAQIAMLMSQNVQLVQDKLELAERLAMAQEENVALQGEIAVLNEMLENFSDAWGGTPREFTPEEEKMLMQIAMAEAESEGVIGKALVMCTVLNRMAVDGKPMDAIVFSGAYHVTHAGGRYYTVTPDEECEIALLMVAGGWDGSQGSRYFCTGGYPQYGVPTFRYKNHWFAA